MESLKRKLPVYYENTIFAESKLFLNIVKYLSQLMRNVSPQSGSLQCCPSGQAYQPAVETAVYIRLDVFVVEWDGQWAVLLNEFYLPKVSIIGYNERLLRETDEQETKAYLAQKLQQTKWLLEQRGSTLRHRAEMVLVAQQIILKLIQEEGPQYPPVTRP